MIKIGRRGSLSGVITVNGRQGHSAYPHLADNPLRGLMQLADALLRPAFDEGTDRLPADQPRDHVDRRRQPGGQRHPGQGVARLQHPLQRQLDGRDAAGRNPQPARPRGAQEDIPRRPQGTGRLRSGLARPAEPRLPHPRRPADRDARAVDRGRHRAARRSSRRRAARPTRASSRTTARWSSSGWSARPCTWSTSASRWPTSRRSPASMGASSKNGSAEHAQDRGHPAISHRRAGG